MNKLHTGTFFLLEGVTVKQGDVLLLAITTSSTEAFEAANEIVANEALGIIAVRVREGGDIITDAKVAPEGATQH